MSSIRLEPAHIRQITAAAEAATPRECCGLLVGTGNPATGIVVTEVVTSTNIAAADRPDRFEVDPEIRFRTMRRLEGTPLDIVGHYHSHPDHPPDPSATDLAWAFEPELAWLIAGLRNGRVTALKAFRLTDDGTAFHPLEALPGSENTFDLPLD
ncbi:MAG: M67 family metallopeptidase [Rhodospirillales bacterium]